MNRLRSLAHEYLLPLVIGALVLRALIPAGFMPVGSGLTLTAALCNAPGVDPTTETIDLGAGENLAGMHCDYCVLPVMAGASALPSLGPAARIDVAAARTSHHPPVYRFALSRTQLPRAPPLA